jgi:predicted dehydrogenase
MNRIKVACIGTGFIAGKHLTALRALDDVDIVAVADSDTARANEVGRVFGARAYTDGGELLAEEELDAVWLCVPPFAHGPLEETAIGRGLPFFVEKPLAHDLATAKAVAARVERQNLLTAVGYHWRYLSLVARARVILRKTAPRLLTGYWLDKTPPAPWWSNRDLSGGQVLEQTTHVFDLVRLLAGEVDRVDAVEVAGDGIGSGSATHAPAAATATLRMTSGAVGSVSSARILYGRHRVGLHVMSDGQAVELSERSLSDHELRVTDARGEEFHRTFEDPIACEDRAFLDAVRDGGGDVRAPYADAIRSHALAWAADLSAREGRPVRVEELGCHG